MPHLDEGTLHALLDGELELAEVKEIQTHLGACTACGSRLQDVKQFLAEADRLVGALEAPAARPEARIEPSHQPPSPLPPPRAGEPWREPVWDSAPKLLLPDEVDDVARRRRWARVARWAAMIAVVIGAGQVIKGKMDDEHLELPLNERDVSSRPETPPPVVSPEEAETPSPSTAKSSRAAAPSNRPAPARPTPEPKVLANAPAVDTAADELDTSPVAAAAAGDSTLGATEDTAPSETQVATSGADRPDTEPEARTERPTPSADAATRRAAAAALEELDRERLRARANAATASLPPARTDAAPAAEVAPPPPPRTLEQRAQIYLRIGLDEAVKQLGQPMHVIEAMTPEFIGLAQGRLVPGADPARPVVRVVYRDNRGRMILLDQQRMQTGQASGAANGTLRWLVGDVMLYLHGEPGPDVLRGLQRRVR